MKTLIEKFFNNSLISMVILSERFTACQNQINIKIGRAHV